MKRPLLTLFAIICLLKLNEVEAKKLTHKECLNIAREINESMSDEMVIDEATTLINTICLPPAHFVYYYTLDMNYKYFKGININDDLIPLLKKINISRFCTQTEMNEFINRLDDIEYRYEDRMGKFIGNYKLKKKDCE